MDSHPEEVRGEEADERHDVDDGVHDRRKSGIVGFRFRFGFRVASLVDDPVLPAPGLLPDVALVFDVADQVLVVEPAHTVPGRQTEMVNVQTSQFCN